jgi:hypothetical protein
LVLSKEAALRLVSGKTEKERQAALLEGQFFVNAEPFILYLSDHAAEESERDLRESPGLVAGVRPYGKQSKATSFTGMASSPTAGEPPPASPRDTSTESLAKVQASYQELVDVVVKELDSEAHFVTYAPPAMVVFRKQIFLEFSLQTPMAGSLAGSRYKLAALAFDDHVAHLVRPLLAYFKGDLDFDGIAFSTSINRQQKALKEQGAEAVEFFLPTAALRCYEAYDCTGQQLINEGFVLINGERVTLDLQTAEAGAN